jgi:putative transposase
MVRVYQYPLRPTKAQEAVLELWLIKSAELYNAALKQRHERISNQRRDFERKLVVSLFARFDLVAYEKLTIARMVHGKLAKSIYDAAWGKFIDALIWKAESAGKWAVPVDPRGTSQRCSNCGNIVLKMLSEREHRCDKCGLALHRDENAACNVLALGLSAGPSPEVASATEPPYFTLR